MTAHGAERRVVAILKRMSDSPPPGARVSPATARNRETEDVAQIRRRYVDRDRVSKIIASRIDQRQKNGE